MCSWIYQPGYHRCSRHCNSNIKSQTPPPPEFSHVYYMSRRQQPLKLPLIWQTNPDSQPVTPTLWLRNVPSRRWTQTFPHWSVSAPSQWLMCLSGTKWHKHTYTSTDPQICFGCILAKKTRFFSFNNNKENVMLIADLCFIHTRTLSFPYVKTPCVTVQLQLRAEVVQRRPAPQPVLFNNF